MTLGTGVQVHQSGKASVNAARPKPFLKWAGGKGQLLAELLARVPASFRVYHEPFVGAGALFFGHCRPSSSWAMIVFTALFMRDFTVPTGMRSAWAISA